MIKIILGGIGSGKSLSCVKNVKSIPNKCYINFNMKDDNIHRLKWCDIIKSTQDLENKNKKPHKDVNWDFWINQIKHNKHINIILDEVHNVFHARRGMSKDNILFSKWISQIRKVTGDSKESHLYLISQMLGRIDITGRDLAQEIILCKKIQYPYKIKTKVLNNNNNILTNVWLTKIYNFHFIGEDCINKYLAYKELGKRSYDYINSFWGNKYMQYYDSYELIDFGREDLL